MGLDFNENMGVDVCACFLGIGMIWDVEGRPWQVELVHFMI